MIFQGCERAVGEGHRKQYTERLEFIPSCRGSLTLSDDLLYFAISAKITINYLK